MKENESALFKCKGCGKPPSFQCREHFVEEIKDLRQKISDILQLFPNCDYDFSDYDGECFSEGAPCSRHLILNVLNPVQEDADEEE